MPTKKTTKKSPAKKTVKKKVAKKAVKKTVKKAVAKKPTVKKTAKKAAKKTTTKKATVRNPKKRKLVYSGDDESFWVKNGQILNSLVALRDALEEMDKEVYLYHTGGAHNDFVNWVDTVLADATCALELKKAKTPKSARTIVIRHLKSYSG